MMPKGRPPFIDEAKAGLRRVLQDRHIGVDDEPAPRGDRRYYFTSHNATTVFLGETKYRGMPVRLNPPRPFLCSVDVLVGYRNKVWQLRDASIVVFYAPGESAEPFPLVRAEWSSDQESNARHAQPHWHVYPWPQAPSTIPIGMQRSRRVGALELERCHWAMCGQFQLSPGGHHVALATADIARWIEQCLVYSLGQLAYVSDKSPRAGPFGPPG